MQAYVAKKADEITVICIADTPKSAPTKSDNGTNMVCTVSWYTMNPSAAKYAANANARDGKIEAGVFIFLKWVHSCVCAPYFSKRNSDVPHRPPQHVKRMNRNRALH